ncbi:NAD-dependent epimerase/dehydratase family protein [Microbacterium sediminis]|nr:NAD-dependent epimerase/dehydratase family protein [Microbacterium sediminis]QBR73380.1 NAD-dependent epimerase/dehydratase family protein [Microbacterium sediminis]
MADTILVTGITGYIGGYVAAEALRRGWRVRGSLRDRARADEVREAIRAAGQDPSGVELVELDLLRDDGWEGAVDGCRFVLHVASPFLTQRPAHADDLIAPAVEGTRRAVTTALRAGAERVVVTSSVAAVQQGHRVAGRPYGPEDWTDTASREVTVYARSKTLAEREAWSIADRLDARGRLAVINPGTVLGPLLTDDKGTSVDVLARLLSGAMPVVPDLHLPWVDVRDIAEAHVAALTSPVAAGRRTIVASDSLSLIEIARIVRERVPEATAALPSRSLRGAALRLASLVVRDLRDNRPFLATPRRFDQSGAEALLGHPLRPIPEAVEDTVRSLLDRGLLA